jgi:RNA polymerase sigma-70 factor (ECF subfamily)
VSDSELVALARAGDTAAFGELVDRHRQAAYRAALSALGSAADADEVAQEAFIAAFRKLEAFRGDASFKTWLLAIVWRRAVDRRTGLGQWIKRHVSLDADQSPWERPTAGRSPEQRAIDADLQRHLKRLMIRLPVALRDVLLLASSGEYRYEEIATMLGIPVGTVKWRVSEARRVLKQKLAAVGYVYD